MVAIKAQFDGRQVILPPDLDGVAAGEVLLIFEESRLQSSERADWHRLQESALAKVWNNDEDAVYDSM